MENEILSNQQIMEMLSGALTLLESDLYDNDNNIDTATSAIAMANVASTLLSFRRAEEMDQSFSDLTARLAAADNPDDAENPDYFDSGEDVPPDDYDAGEESS